MGSGPEQRGFSLLELVLVLLIAGLALAVSYPNLARGTAAFHLRAAGRDVLNMLRFAREKAITEQANMLITADREKQQVTLAGAVGGGARRYALPDDVKIARLFLSGKEVPEASITIRFLPNGSCETAEIVLQSSSGALVRVVTDPLTGGARIEADRGGRP